jgi:predicted dehydrogenase
MTESGAVDRPGVGLISVGWMGRLHTKAYQAVPLTYPELGIRPRLLVAADAEPSRAKYAADVLGYARGVTDYREVLADPEVDIVSICAPNFLHAEMGVAAARAGKHFWIEKPVGRGYDEALAVAQAAQQAGVVTTVGFNYRHAPAVEHIKQLVADGVLGRITNVRCVFFAGYSADPRGALSWRFKRELAGSGVLGDLGSHAVDLCTYLVGPVSDVTALTTTVHTRRPILPMGSGTHFAVIDGGEQGEVANEDYVGALLRFGGSGPGAGAVGTIESSRVAVGPDCRYAIEIYGTEGSVAWDFERMNELKVFSGPGAAERGYVTVNANATYGDFARFQPGAGCSMGFDDLKTIEAKKFLAAVAGVASDSSTIADAVASAAFVTAAEESAASGQWVRLPSISGTTAAGVAEPGPSATG